MIKKGFEKLDQLEDIKKLLILGLIHQGITGRDIAAILEVDPAVVSRMLPKKQKH